MSAARAAGATLGPLRIASVSPAAMKQMAVVLHDPNQIHLDPEAVRAVGLGDRVINQGPSNCGYLMNMLLDAFPAGRLRTFKARFLANVLGGDAVLAAGTIDSIDSSPNGWLYNCTVWLDIEGRGRALQGSAAVFVPAD